MGFFKKKKLKNQDAINQSCQSIQVFESQGWLHNGCLFIPLPPTVLRLYVSRTTSFNIIRLLLAAGSC